MKVEPQMSVAGSHSITEIIAKNIEKKYPNSSVTIHMEPCDGKCDADCLGGCLLSEKERQNIQIRLRVRSQGDPPPRLNHDSFFNFRHQVLHPCYPHWK